MKNSDLLGSVESLNILAALKQPVRTSFVIALNIRAINEHLKVIEEQRKKLVEEFTRKDDKGVALPAYQPGATADGKPLLDETGEPIPGLVDAQGKPPAVVEGQVRLTDPKAFYKKLEDLQDLDVTDVVHIRPVKLSLLEGTIEPKTLVGILWAINDDVSEPAAAPAAAPAK